MTPLELPDQPGRSATVIAYLSLKAQILHQTLLDKWFQTSFILGCVCSVASVVSSSLRSYGLQTAGLLCPWGSPGKNTRVDCHALLQGIFLTQGLKPVLPHCKQILYHLSHQGSPRKLEWIAYPFSRGYS